MTFAVYATWEVAKEGPERDSNAERRDATAVLYQLCYQAKWELVIMFLGYHKSVDSGYTRPANFWGLSFATAQVA